MKEALAEFLKTEFNLTPEDLEKMNEDQLSDLFDQAADIEVGELVEHGEPITKRCRLACDLEDYINDNFFEPIEED